MKKIKIPIPEADLKFIKTVDAKICPKCNSVDVFDTGYQANNVDGPAGFVPEHPVYRCKMCAQLFRVRIPQK